MGGSIFASVVKNIQSAHKHSICHSVKSIKYICKYLNKGTGMVIVGMHQKIVTGMQYELSMELHNTRLEDA